MTFRARSNTVRLKTGRVIPLNGPLLAGNYRPHGGWTARFRIKGIDRMYQGRTAQEVARKVSSDHADNNVPLTGADVWLNLNLQWMEKTPLNRFMVEKGELTKAINDGTEPEKTLRKTYAPEVWGSRAWNWLGLFLAQDNYSAGAFLQELEQVLLMLSPASNPVLGCIKCYTEFDSELSQIRMSPPMTQEDARRWLWSLHNKINSKLNKKQLTFEEAAKVNFWS